MKVAVVGSGVSGLAATWLLNEYSDHDVHLYESDSRPGGHANTVRFVPPGKKGGFEEGVDVDTGFIVFNPTTYPNFLRFLNLYAPPSGSKISWLTRFLPTALQRSSDGEQGITIVPTEMTFSVTRDGGAFEWAGKNLFTVFCQPRRVFDPQMWRMVYDVLRFNVCSRQYLLQQKPGLEGPELSIGDYLAKEKYSTAFCYNYLIPMTAAIWSTPPGKCALDFPARTLIQFMYNHHLLQITGKPSWLTIQGGSHKYVNQILSNLPDTQLHLNTPIRSATSYARNDSPRSKVVLKTEAGVEAEYDHVIFACHSDTALQILEAGNSTDEESRILGMFEWNKNEVVLHADPRLMPKSRLAWSCWNYLTTTEYPSTADDASSEDQISLTYGMNDLQHIPEARYGPVLATLNPPFQPAPDKTVGRWKYDHPVLDAKAVKAQNEMYKIQNQRSITFAGAYLKYGFHEDGFTSGLLAACAIDEAPGKFPTFSPSSPLGPSSSTDLNIPVRGTTVKPPFEIQYADHHISLQNRGTRNVETFLVKVFDWLEVSGFREFVGMVGALVLYLVSVLLGLRNMEH